MRSWPLPEVPTLSGDGVPLSLYDTADDVVRPVRTDWASGEGVIPQT